MARAEDIAKIIEQEKTLVFPFFDEATAFAIGSAIRDHGLANTLTLVADVRLWDRPLFYVTMPGTTGDNADWVRRKSNSVKRFHKSTYRMVLERTFEDVIFPPSRALDANDYVLAGGAFPISVKGAGVIGSITVSGLAEREDHSIVVDAIANHLGLDGRALALAPV